MIQFAKLAWGFLKPKLLVYWARLGDDRLGGHARGMGLEQYVLIWGHVHWGWILWGLRCGGCAAGSDGVDEGEGALHIALCHGLFQLVCY